MATKQKKTKTTPARVPARPIEQSAEKAWLEKTNPMIGLSIRTAQNIFDCARNGDTQKLHWLFQEIEAVNPALFTCIERREAAVANFQYTVTSRPEADQTLADEQRDAVTAFIGGIRNLTALFAHLEGAFFRGFSFAQPIWEADNAVREIVLHNSWEFLTVGGRLYHNPSCNGLSPDCVDCEDAGLIGLTHPRCVDYPALAMHIRHAVGSRDWGRFLERYALPKPAVTMSPNATNEQRNDYLVAARAVENGQVSVWPNGTNITDFAGGSRGTDPFKSFLEFQEQKIVLLATGGTLTSLAQADTGSLAGGAQMEVWKEIVGRDATVIAQAVMASLVRPFLERVFWGRPCCVDFSLDIPKKQTPKEVAELAATLKQAGYLINQSELEKAVGFTLVKDASAPAPGFGFARARATEKKADKPDDVLTAFAADCKPVAEAIQAFLKNPTNDAAEDLMKQLPGLIPEDPALAAVIAEAMAEKMSETVGKEGK